MTLLGLIRIGRKTGLRLAGYKWAICEQAVNRLPMGRATYGPTIPWAFSRPKVTAGSYWTMKSMGHEEAESQVVL